MRICVTLALWLVSVGVASAQVSLGLAKDNDWPSREHIARMESHSLTDHAVVYYALTSEANLANPFDWVRDNYVNAGIPTIMTLIIDDRTDPTVTTVGTSEGTDVSAGVPGLLQRVIDGEFDEALHTLAVRIRDNGRPLTIRPFHELDGSWYQWGIYADGNSRGLAVAAVAHIIDVFDTAGAESVTWEINFNRRDGQNPGQVLGEAEFLIPRLNELVDQYSVSTYNRCGTAPWYGEERSFADDFRPIYDRIAALSDLPINVAEVSTSGLCGPRLAWFAEMLADLDQFPQLEMVTFFFGTVPIGRASNDVPIYWGFDQEPELLPAFRELITEQREAAATPPRSPELRPEPRVTYVTPAPVPLRFPEPERQIAEPVLAEASACLSVFCFDSAPWSFWGSLDYRFVETPNDATNPLTGNPYGDTGTVLRWSLRQRGLWDINSRTSWGPGLQFAGAQSTNSEQFWNNNVFLGGTLGIYSDIERGRRVGWGSTALELYLGREQFTVDAPDRFGSDGGHTVGGIRLIINSGGDWAN